MVYTRQVIDETLRLYPPAYALSRFGNRADVVGGYDVQASAAITLCPFITQRLPEFWHQPLEFDPDRFNPANDRDRHRFAYLPFGAGRGNVSAKALP